MRHRPRGGIVALGVGRPGEVRDLKLECRHLQVELLQNLSFLAQRGTMTMPTFR